MNRKLVWALVAASILSVYSVKSAHAYNVYGDILKVYQAEGGEGGELGAPTSDEQPYGTSGDRINYFQHGYILWWKANAETVVHVYDQRFTYRIPHLPFPDPDPVGGWNITLTVRSNGDYGFSGRFHSAATIFNPVSQNTNITVAIAAPTGVVFTFSDSGSVSAYSRDHDWNKNGNDPALASRWGDLQRGGVRFIRSASTRLDIGGLINGIVSAIGFVSTVIKVVA
ncbi:hypothetical protein [Sorangium sp. So ce128]|uniref:hypothetical protein n=1 Tax=Sorangium sp. So ce128 TaxID=3133281 RepID=UPI003F62FD66